MKKILFLAAEAVPFAATGGLGDVVGSLSKALSQYEENDVRVMLPLYSGMNGDYRDKLVFLKCINVPLSWRSQYCGIFTYQLGKVTYYFLDNEYYFKRGSYYGEFDDGERFAFFCRACLEVMPHIDFFPDILHAHDWHCALSIIYHKTKYIYSPLYAGIKTVLSIHNIMFQGIYSPTLAGDVFDLGEADMPLVEYNKCINLLKGAIVACDLLLTVSPTYAKEILSEKFSYGLHYVLEQNKGKLYGILNGIDTDYYNPTKDKTLPATFSFRAPEGKAVCKRALQEQMGLEVNPDIPVFAVISRLTEQKGLDLIMLAADDILRENIQLVVLGKGDFYYEGFFYHLARRYPERVRTVLEFDTTLSRQIYAGADFFLMPSKTEPCGLAQMIASRYGAVPIIHETGGLYDSIKDIGWETGGNGFTFASYSAWELLCTVRRAAGVYTDTELFKKIVKDVMRCNFSWKNSAKEYMNMYGNLI